MPTPSPRVALVLSTGFCFLLLAPLCFGEHDDDANLKSLYNAHRWFELRDSVAKSAAPVFYQGALACAFNDLHRCEKKLGAVLKSRPQSDDAVEAHKLLASAYLRLGKYREALAQVDALRPGDADALGDDLPLLAALRGFPDQQVVRRGSPTLGLRDGLPISINGVQATYWFDTGAYVSGLRESEAKRFGLRVRAVSVKVGGVTGAESDARIAVADELSIGSIRLRHVAFLVFSDDQPPFNQSPPGEGGLIGIPVLLALQRLGWVSRGANAKLEIRPKSSNENVPHADLCFDGNHPVVQIRFENHSLAFTLDTGATNTDLYPPFAAAFPDLIRTSSKTESYKVEGVGGAKTMDAALLSSLHFSIGGFPVVLSPAGVLLTHTIENSKFFHGNLGVDLLQQAHKTTFDFKAMTLTLE
jgi:hypothetical protein